MELKVLMIVNRVNTQVATVIIDNGNPKEINWNFIMAKGWKATVVLSTIEEVLTNAHQMPLYVAKSVAHKFPNLPCVDELYENIGGIINGRN